ncbi:alanine/glycine:cation symporter family protein [Ruminococcus flavefaciens]|uniref:alanine/glycine:cation symporter family protein n=1 Tax=Ruminococcus flavefaciens TaxID=1265 RepID=UPI0026F1888D|nr:amino acid carrier protein [Ruminococcus flavefaciens]
MLEKVNSYVWGVVLISLLLMTGALYTFKLRFIQLRMFPYFIKNAKKGGNNGQFRTICMSLGTAMGTGNITGVASAISIGGTGAVFWMWISAFFGMATVYAENSLSAQFTDKKVRGTMAYIEKGLGSKCLAVFFSICCILACFGMGGMVQINALSESMRNCTDIPPFFLSLVLFLLIYAIISGGAKRIGSAAQILLPFATVLYTVLCIFVIAKYSEKLPYVFSQIINEAFGIKQAAGGISGYALSKAVSAGIRRGVFSNEAGLGSSPILHSSAENANNSAMQGMSSMLEVFIDTMLCCTLTAIVILCASEDNTVRTAFFHVMGVKTDIFLAVIMSVFALCTVIGWYYCGETAFKYLFKSRKAAIFAFTFSLTASLGAIFKAESIWTISDIFNGLMAFPNLLALLLLFKHVKSE